MVPEAAAQAAGGPAPPSSLGLPAGGDAVDGHRLRPGEKVEGGRGQEGGLESAGGVGRHGAGSAPSRRAALKAVPADAAYSLACSHVPRKLPGQPDAA